MPITTKDGLLEAWAEGLETLEQNLETLYGPSGITPTLPSITTKDGMLEAIAEKVERTAFDFAELYNATTTETNNAHIVTVPSNARYYGGLSKIGGKSVAWNQHVDTGTTSVTLVTNHKYYTKINGTESIQTGAGSTVSVAEGDMVCDLSVMFGNGYEPSSVAAFKAIFPDDITTYEPGTFINAGVTSVVSKDRNGNTIGEYEVPDEVQAINGYGLSSLKSYNYVDLKAKTFVKNVASMTIDGASVVNPSSTYTNIVYYRYAKPADYSGYNTFNSQATSPVMAEKFVCKAISGSDDAKWIGTMTAGAQKLYFWFGFPFGTTLDEAKAALDGMVLTYQLTTPETTDISAYLGDNSIKIEPGGTLTFENQAGYGIPVHSDVDYLEA